MLFSHKRLAIIKTKNCRLAPLLLIGAFSTECNLRMLSSLIFSSTIQCQVSNFSWRKFVKISELVVLFRESCLGVFYFPELPRLSLEARGEATSIIWRCKIFFCMKLMISENNYLDCLYFFWSNVMS